MLKKSKCLRAPLFAAFAAALQPFCSATAATVEDAGVADTAFYTISTSANLDWYTTATGTVMIPTNISTDGMKCDSSFPDNRIVIWATGDIDPEFIIQAPDGVDPKILIGKQDCSSEPGNVVKSKKARNKKKSKGPLQ